MEDDTRDRYVPLSARYDPDTAASYTSVLHEGVPTWLRPSLRDWLVPFVTVEKTYYMDRSTILPDGGAIRSMERALRLEGLPIGTDEAQLLNAFVRLIETVDGAVVLDIVDYCLHSKLKEDQRSVHAVVGLEKILQQAGSAWTPQIAVPSQLLQRVDATTNEAFLQTASGRDRASEHLRTAWSHTYGRSPDPGKAYAEAVKAIEASAKPIVLPDDGKATLGKMIFAMNDKPEKWLTVFDHEPSSGVTQVASMMGLIWKGHSDRHGTDDADAPTDISPEQAEAAVQGAVTLVQWFRSGVIVKIS